MSDLGIVATLLKVPAPKLEEALTVYHSTFRPSEQLAEPHVMVAAGVFVADTDAEARYLRSSQVLSFARLRTGRPGKLPAPVEDVTAEIPPHVLAQVDQALSVSATGSPDTVRRGLSAILERYQPDELIVTGMIHDHAARVRSFELAAGILADLAEAA